MLLETARSRCCLSSIVLRAGVVIMDHDDSAAAAAAKKLSIEAFVLASRGYCLTSNEL